MVCFWLLVAVTLTHTSTIHMDELFSGFVFDGWMNMSDTSYQYGVKDRVNFTFNIEFTTTNVTNLTIDVHGDSLMFEKEGLEFPVLWNISSNESNESSAPSFNYQSTNSADTAEWSTIYRISISDFPNGTWLFSGDITSVVADDAGPGSLVRGIIDMKCYINNDSVIDQFVSDYVYTLPMTLWPVGYNGSLQLQSLLEKEVHMAFTEGSVTPKVTVMTPVENISEEVPITIQKMSANASCGISERDVDSLTFSWLNLRSTPTSYQNDIGILELPTVSRTDSDYCNESEIVVNIKGRLEDFTDISTVKELDVGVGVLFGKAMVWVSKTAAHIDVTNGGSRRPELNLKMYQVCVIANEERFDVTVSIVASHSSASTATAYNVTLFLYAMDSMTHVSYTLSKAKGYRSKWNTSGNVRTYEVERITFSTPMHTSVVERIDMSTVAMRQADDFVVMAEVVYTDRWVNDVEFWTGLQYVRLSLPLRCAKKLHWTVSTNCSCVHNASLANCGCCEQGACQCGKINPQLCLPCDILAFCDPTLPGFSDYSYLEEDGSTIVCDAFYKYRAIRKETSCYRQFTGGYKPAQAFPASVGVILGRDKSTNHLYGISNNGLAYVLSMDDGLTWMSISPTLYTRVASTGNYQPSTLVKTT